jgi:MoaA/NifB/PqqE/SkfB family radical SAM enzyme
MRFFETLRLGLRVADAAWVRGRPFLLYYKPTARCDLKCAICQRWQDPRPAREELPLAEVRAMLRRFRDAGAAFLTLWGGEPLLRTDLPEILVEAQRLGLHTSMCTNGFQLARRAGEVVPHLDTLLCSLDGLGEVHDAMRGVRGAFDHAVAGLEAARRVARGDVKIWASLHRRDVDQIDGLAALARDLGVGIELFPIAAVPGYNDELVLDGPALAAAFGRVRALKREGRPIRSSDRALALQGSGGAFTCNLGPSALQVDHDGRVHSCEAPDGAPLHAWGRVEDLDPAALARTPAFRAAGAELRRCNRCRLPCVVELSGSLPVALARTAAGNAARRL